MRAERAERAHERMNVDASVSAAARPRPTIQHIPARPAKIQIDALMETNADFAGSMGRTTNVVSVSYGDAKRSGPAGITKKRRTKAVRSRIVVKSLRTVKHDLDKKRGTRALEEGADMDVC